MKPQIFFLLGVILVVTPFVFSFDCEYFNGLDRDNCIALNSTDEGMIVNLIYTNHSMPDFAFISEYNSIIVIDAPPYDAVIDSKEYIKNAWISIIEINPLIDYENQSYIPSNIDVWIEYDYDLDIPEDYYNDNERNGATCKITYKKTAESYDFAVYSNDIYVGDSKHLSMQIIEDSTIKASLDVAVEIETKYYEWKKYSNGENTYYKCEYDKTKDLEENIYIKDSKLLKYYAHNLTYDAIITSRYQGTLQGNIIKDNLTSITLNLDNSSYSINEFEYYAKFKKEPYYLIELEAIRSRNVKINNLYANENVFYAPESNTCSITGTDFFEQTTKTCEYNINETPKRVIATGITPSLTFLMMIIVFIFVLFMLYKGIKYYWGRYILVLLLLIPSVRAEDCGLTNLASCIPQKIFEFLISILNAPLQPLLTLFQNLLSNPPSIELFGYIWAIIIYCLSIFYSFLIMYAGLQFLISGHNVVRREMAKEWLKNTVLMMVLIQASFYLYQLTLDISSIMTTGILSLVDQTFFLLTADNITNVGLQFLFITAYVLFLFITILFLTLRYVVVAIGVIFAPIGIFCYFIPPLRSYGKLILNLLGMLIFITIIDAIIILACSKMLEVAMFQNFKILLMIACLLIINILFIILTKHILHKTGIENNTDKIAQAIKYIGMIG